MKKRIDLPNIEGFKFIAIMADGTEIESEIKKHHVSKCHYTDHFIGMIGWKETKFYN